MAACVILDVPAATPVTVISWGCCQLAVVNSTVPLTLAFAGVPLVGVILT